MPLRRNIGFDIIIKTERDGNFNPVEIMLQGTPEQVKEAVRQCKKLSSRNHNIIAPGCEVPKDTPRENMLALLEALKE